MAGFKLGRTSEDLRRELMDILRNMKDPRISGGMISILRIELTNDLSHCKVYISSLEGMEKAKEAVKVLKNAAGFIRHELTTRLEIRKIPELHFIPDDSIEHSADIQRILREIEEK
jgi:ribosome-binding factor A